MRQTDGPALEGVRCKCNSGTPRLVPEKKLLDLVYMHPGGICEGMTFIFSRKADFVKHTSAHTCAELREGERKVFFENFASFFQLRSWLACVQLG